MENSNRKVIIPLTITVQINSETGEISQTESVTREAMPPATPSFPVSEQDILHKAQETIGKRPDVLSVRLGYKFENGIITKKRAIVVVVQQRKSITELAKNNISPVPDAFMGYPVDITTPSLNDLIDSNKELVRNSGFIVEPESRYFPPPGVKLKKITKQKMKVIACVSPEQGWKELKPFIEAAQTSFTLGMFDLGAPHIITSMRNLGKKKSFKKFLLTLQPGQSIGKKEDANNTKRNDKTDQQAVNLLSKSLGNRFDMSWVHIGSVNGWVNSSYHIKVAVKDKKAIHLSSGNYQSSNQPDDKIVDNNTTAFLISKYNREWHVILEHNEIARLYETFIKHDLENNRPDARESLITNQDLFLLTPLQTEVEAEAINKKSFSPYNPGQREYTVTPLLSPDNYFEEVLKLVKKAKRQLYIQNQTFNFPKEGHDKLDELVTAVLEKQQAGVDVRVIFRDLFRATTRENIEKLVEKGFESTTFKFHGKVHTKGILVDDEFVCIGSQNWSNAGVSVNRDASLLFQDKELTAYFKEIFLHDWDFVAGNRLGRDSMNSSIVTGEAAIPEGMQLIPLKDILEAM
jgi:hypothetical protein